MAFSLGGFMPQLYRLAVSVDNEAVRPAKVGSIKLLRDFSGMGLKAAKRIVDALHDDVPSLQLSVSGEQLGRLFYLLNRWEPLWENTLVFGNVVPYTAEAIIDCTNSETAEASSEYLT
jgi:hypothetical protein